MSKPYCSKRQKLNRIIYFRKFNIYKYIWNKIQNSHRKDIPLLYFNDKFGLLDY